MPRGRKKKVVLEMNDELKGSSTANAGLSMAMGESPTFAALERFMTIQWNFVSQSKAFYHNDGNMPVILKMWSPEFDFGKEILQTIPLWWGINVNLRRRVK
ncbi:hypothetical protein RDI58_001478 [Solanum bulbocastanum]|uniref:DUF4283 domain-containing protein n=1 Tax=Solanum bulbocastanum TaxID=147425 RepID=A0AAN8U551_SOLBU